MPAVLALRGATAGASRMCAALALRPGIVYIGLLATARVQYDEQFLMLMNTVAQNLKASHP